MTVNPYQDVIDWLHTSEGESWSESRMQTARVCSGTGSTLTRYGNEREYNWRGILSLKTDDDHRHTSIFVHSQRLEGEVNHDS